MNDIHIGKYCSIADSVLFDGGIQHNSKWLTTFPLWKIGAPENREGMCRGDTHVGSDVWIGHEALIMSGVTIGNGAIIAARAVVTHNVRPYAVVGGVPARFIRWRLPEVAIAMMQEIRWWDWPEEKIREHADLLMSGDWQRFIEASGYRRTNSNFVLPRTEDYELGN
jgi:carbonic anhydrase/acetyltransferase-like protein (isoleucine patch superfamily)